MSLIEPRESLLDPSSSSVSESFLLEEEESDSSLWSLCLVVSLEDPPSDCVEEEISVEFKGLLGVWPVLVGCFKDFGSFERRLDIQLLLELLPLSTLGISGSLRVLERLEALEASCSCTFLAAIDLSSFEIGLNVLTVEDMFDFSSPPQHARLNGVICLAEIITMYRTYKRVLHLSSKRPRCRDSSWRRFLMSWRCSNWMLWLSSFWVSVVGRVKSVLTCLETETSSLKGSVNIWINRVHFEASSVDILEDGLELRLLTTQPFAIRSSADPD